LQQRALSRKDVQVGINAAVVALQRNMQYLITLVPHLRQTLQAFLFCAVGDQRVGDIVPRLQYGLLVIDRRFLLHDSAFSRL